MASLKDFILLGDPEMRVSLRRKLGFLNLGMFPSNGRYFVYSRGTIVVIDVPARFKDQISFNGGEVSRNDDEDRFKRGGGIYALKYVK